MSRTLLLLGVLRERAGTDTVELELPPAATIGELREALARAHPELAEFLPSCAVAVAHAYRSDEAGIGEAGEEIAIVPPVSGG